jgi:thioredoxin-related protein
MLFRETAAVYCENHTEHTDTVRTLQETHYISAAKPKRLMLFGETVAVYCENHTEHTDTVHTSEETHYISTTKLNRLMLFEETVAVYCENYTERMNTLCSLVVRVPGYRTEMYCVSCEVRTELICAM